MDIPAVLNVVSGVAIAVLGIVLVAADPRKDWNRIFALLAIFWGAQIVSANAVRLAPNEAGARLAGELSLAFLLPLYFFVVMFAAIFPRPRGLFSTSPLAVAALTLPALAALVALFARSALLLRGVQARAPEGYTMQWGPAIPLLAAALYASFFYALFLMMRRLDEAESPVERKQVTFVLAAIAVYVAYSVPAQLILFGSAVLGVGAAPEGQALLLTGVMLVGLALLARLVHQLARRKHDARWVLVSIGVAAALALLSPFVESLGLVRLASVGLIVYAIARFQLFEVDLRVKQVAAGGAALLVVAALAGAAWSLLAGVQGGALIAVLAGVIAFVPLLRISSRVADRVAPAVSREGDHLYLRKLDVYRASVEATLREGRDARAQDAWLQETRAKLGLTERDHAVVVSLAAAGAEPRPAAPGLEVGRIAFGKYFIERVLAEGGYGRVFLARDKILGRTVVVKELLARWRGDPRVVKTFLQEARIAGELDHPNVVRVFAVEQHGQDHYIVMEHVQGGTLADRLAGTALVPAPEALRIARGVLEGLAAAHAKGVVHRDIKPANVLIDARGTVKLADFGIAQVESQDPQRTISGLTTGSFHPGTLQFMSPEQARGLPLDARSDVYAVGAMLYLMLTGRPHVDVRGMDEFSARTRIAEARSVAPPVPGALGAAAARALAPEPSARFATARAFVEALNLEVEPAEAP